MLFRFLVPRSGVQEIHFHKDIKFVKLSVQIFYFLFLHNKRHFINSINQEKGVTGMSNMKYSFKYMTVLNCSFGNYKI